MHVCGDTIPFGEQDNVVADQLTSSNPTRMPIANNQGAWTRQIPQGLEGTLRSALLDEGDAHDNNDKAEQHEGFMAIA